jgi:hypothetical protein
MMPTRRRLVGGAGALAMVLGARVGGAASLASLKLDEAAKVLREGSLEVPATQGPKSPGISSADIAAPGRGLIAIDWSFDLTAALIVVLAPERRMPALMGGQTNFADSFVRLDVLGPETAGTSASVTAGRYAVAFLNRGNQSVPLVYRISFRAY